MGKKATSEAILSRERLLRHLHGYNPWWTGRATTTPGFRRTAFFRCRSLLLDETNRRAIVLTGPRRVGKSVLLAQIAADLIKSGRKPASVLYLSLDDNILKLVALREILSAFREAILPEGEQAVLLLDEIHYTTGWEQELKTLVDHHQEYRILATGSAALDVETGGTHSGVGRWHTVPIPTLSFFEFLHIRQEAPPSVPQNRVTALHTVSASKLTEIALRLRPSLPLFRRYLLVGGFPETALNNDTALCQRLLREDIVDRVLKWDITSLFGVRAVNELERLFLYLCLQSGGQLNVERCCRSLEANRTTVLNHLDLLVKANLLYRLGPDRTSGKKLLKAQNKYYLIDAALRNAVLLSGEEVLDDLAETGRIVETAIFRHLYASFYREAPVFSYWREPGTDREVDIILRFPGFTAAVEVKYRDDAEISARDGIVRFCELDRPSSAMLITRRDRDFGCIELGEAGKIMRIPAHIFCYLIGQSERLNAGA